MSENNSNQLNIEKTINIYKELLWQPERTSWKTMFFRCPYHQEKTWSFAVSKDIWVFKCFWCWKSWNIFTLIKDKFPNKTELLWHFYKKNNFYINYKQELINKYSWQIINSYNKEYINKRFLPLSILKNHNVNIFDLKKEQEKDFLNDLKKKYKKIPSHILNEIKEIFNEVVEKHKVILWLKSKNIKNSIDSDYFIFANPQPDKSKSPKYKNEKGKKTDKYFYIGRWDDTHITVMEWFFDSFIYNLFSKRTVNLLLWNSKNLDYNNKNIIFFTDNDSAWFSFMVWYDVEKIFLNNNIDFLLYGLFYKEILNELEEYLTWFYDEYIDEIHTLLNNKNNIIFLLKIKDINDLYRILLKTFYILEKKFLEWWLKWYLEKILKGNESIFSYINKNVDIKDNNTFENLFKKEYMNFFNKIFTSSLDNNLLPKTQFIVIYFFYWIIINKKNNIILEQQEIAGLIEKYKKDEDNENQLLAILSLYNSDSNKDIYLFLQLLFFYTWNVSTTLQILANIIFKNKTNLNNYIDDYLNSFSNEYKLNTTIIQMIDILYRIQFINETNYNKLRKKYIWKLDEEENNTDEIIKNFNDDEGQDFIIDSLFLHVFDEQWYYKEIMNKNKRIFGYIINTLDTFKNLDTIDNKTLYKNNKGTEFMRINKMIKATMLFLEIIKNKKYKNMFNSFFTEEELKIDEKYFNMESSKILNIYKHLWFDITSLSKIESFIVKFNWIDMSINNMGVLYKDLLDIENNDDVDVFIEEYWFNKEQDVLNKIVKDLDIENNNIQNIIDFNKKYKEQIEELLKEINRNKKVINYLNKKFGNIYYFIQHINYINKLIDF